MDISPIYELRSRLRAAMIAGTNLLPEDFRLKRAAEAIAPFQTVSPVFAKIGQLSNALLDRDQEDKEGKLLEAITLVDAVLCTQAAVGVSADTERKALPETFSGPALTNAPYSVVKTLLEALTTSGSGHYSYVLETHEKQPELFQDYRMKDAMVQALGASYAELADNVEDWLKEEDSSVFPLLQKGFDPHGKKESVRRLRIMEAIDPAEANDFFVEQLPEAEKEVRQTILFALRHCQENIDLLLELAKAEKGGNKKFALSALACMEDERAEAFFRELYQKKPQTALEALRYSCTGWACELAVQGVKDRLRLWTDHVKLPKKRWIKDRLLSWKGTPGGERVAASEEDMKLLETALLALTGKAGRDMAEVWELVLMLGQYLNHPYEDKEALWKPASQCVSTYAPRSSSDSPLNGMLSSIFKQTTVMTGDEEIGKLAAALYERDKTPETFAAAATAKLLSKDGDSEWFKKQFSGSDTGRKKDLYSQFFIELHGLFWNQKRREYTFRLNDINQYGVSPVIRKSVPYSYIQPVSREMAWAAADMVMDRAKIYGKGGYLYQAERILRKLCIPGEEGRIESYVNELEEKLEELRHR